MEQYNSIDLLQSMFGVSLVKQTKHNLIINITNNYKDGVKAYLNISKDEFEISKINKTLFGFEIFLKIKQLIIFNQTK